MWATAGSRSSRSLSLSPGRVSCWSKSLSAASAAPTCTWSSSSTPGPAPCSATSGRARWPRRRAPGRMAAGERVVFNPRPVRAPAARAGGAGPRSALTTRLGHPRHPRCLRPVRDRAGGQPPPCSRLAGPGRAALAEPTAIALHAIELADITPDDRVLVTGAGPVGLLIIAILRARGVTDITVSEPVASGATGALAGRPALGPTSWRTRTSGSTVRRPMPSPSNARAGPPPPSRRSASSTSPAPWCSWAPVRSRPG